MRTSQRDKRPIWYALYQGVTDVTDADGNLNGEQAVSYTDPVKAMMNVSGGRGQAAIEAFGIENPFTVSAVTGDLTTPFNTDTIFWFGIDPVSASGENVAHNFICTGVARTINGVVLALKELDITHENNSSPFVSG